MSNFIDKTFEFRINEYNKIKNKYPYKIPIIMTSYYENLKLDKNKYIVDFDMKVFDFTYFIRKKVNIEDYKALFIFCNNILLNSSMVFYDVHDRHKNNDGFLYLIISEENVFGYTSTN